MEKATIGNMRLDMCISTDRQFAAFQLFRFVDYIYQPEIKVKIYEGDDASLLSGLFLD